MKDVQVEVIKTTESDQDPKLVEVHYPYVLDYPEYIKPRILLEIGCRSLIEPYTNRKITSLVDTCFPDAEFVSEPIEVASVNPERTFLEKIFLLHEEFQKENIRSERMSRHLYDLFKLMQIPRCREALKDRALYDTIVNHRKQFTKLKEVDYDKYAPKYINFIPPGKVLGAYKKDYNDMRENMINGESPSFDHLLKELNSLKSELNNTIF